MNIQNWTPPRARLSRQDDDFLISLEGYMALHHRMPSFRWLEKNLSMGRSKIERRLCRLEERGYLKRHPTGTIPAALIPKEERR